MTEQQTRPVRDPDHDEFAAALSQAVALRALHSYRAARDRAEWRRADMALLIEPAAFSDIDDAYERLIEEVIDYRITNPGAARVAVDLLAAIVADQTLGEILDEGPPVSIEKDRLDALRLVAGLSGWVNNLEINETIEEERAKVIERDGAVPTVAEPAAGDAPEPSSGQRRTLAAGDLDDALTDIRSACEILTRGDNDDIVHARYLGRQIEDHCAAAWDAYCRIFGLDQHGPQREGEPTGGAA